jgi:parvulin-like peptidyl-prolyl isomerase
LANSESATKASGGLVGPVNVEDLSPALKELAAKLESGGISEPVRTPRGYQMFRLETRSVPELRPFDEVRRSIENAIRNERIGPETEKMLARLRTQAVIEWKDENLRQIYEKEITEAAAP